MSEREPWVVRQLYSTVDRSFGAYLNAMRDLLAYAVQAGWISRCLDKPISLASEIARATADMELGELLIVDLHGWADSDGARLSPAAEGLFADLADIPANGWGPAAIVLTNCRGARDQFSSELSRILRYPAAVAGHFDEAGTYDHTPIEMIRTILAETDGGDDAGAFNAMGRAIYNRGAASRRGLGSGTIAATLPPAIILFQVFAAEQEDADLSPDNDALLAPRGPYTSAVLHIASSSSPARWPPEAVSGARGQGSPGRAAWVPGRPRVSPSAPAIDLDDRRRLF